MYVRNFKNKFVNKLPNRELWNKYGIKNDFFVEHYYKLKPANNVLYYDFYKQKFYNT